MRPLHIICILGLTASSVSAQGSIASRIASAPDGVVRMEYESRYGVCGDGRELVGYRNALWARNFQTYGKWQSNNCSPGPLRVTLTLAGGQVRQVRTQVGGRWETTDARVTDLGVVLSTEASAYFFSIVPQLEMTYEKDRALLPAVLADDAPVVAPLIGIARNTARLERTRKNAMLWLGMFADSTARRFLHTVIESAAEAVEIRSHAIFSLANGDVPEVEFAYLRTLYARLDEDKLKESVLFGMAQGEEPGSRWLIERAMDTRERMKLRKNAFFWAGQSEATRTADLVRAYRSMTDDDLRDHAIFVLSQRNDEAALQALITIAKEDPDRKVRGKALFWLAQKQDPRATQLISDILTKP
jgi:hypothetical protein